MQGPAVELVEDTLTGTRQMNGVRSLEALQPFRSQRGHIAAAVAFVTPLDHLPASLKRVDDPGEATG